MMIIIISIMIINIVIIIMIITSPAVVGVDKRVARTVYFAEPAWPALGCLTTMVMVIMSCTGMPGHDDDGDNDLLGLHWADTF